MMLFLNRLRFGVRYAALHFGASVLVALASAALVFGWMYPSPYWALLGVERIFLIMLIVDAACGPLLTLVICAPQKSKRELRLDLSVVVVIQFAALAYGLHSQWAARPVVLAFEVDRLVVVRASEIDKTDLHNAPSIFQILPKFGIMKVGTRSPVNSDEMLKSVGQDLEGLSPAMRPGWWISWEGSLKQMRPRTRPLSELISRRPESVKILRDAASQAGMEMDHLRYLPLTSSQVKEWVALLDSDLNIVGYAPVDGF